MNFGWKNSERITYEVIMMWIETKDDRIFEVVKDLGDEIIGREVLYKLDTPKLHYGEIETINKGDVIWT